MKHFWIEGVILVKTSIRSKNRSLKPVSDSVWANTAEEAVRMAMENHPNVQWIEGPILRTDSEEQRMRQLGAPELPGLTLQPPKKSKHR